MRQQVRGSRAGERAPSRLLTSRPSRRFAPCTTLERYATRGSTSAAGHAEKNGIGQNGVRKLRNRAGVVANNRSGGIRDLQPGEIHQGRLEHGPRVSPIGLKLD